MPFLSRHPVLSRLGLLLISALGLSFAFAPFPLRFLSSVALVPLLWLIQSETPARAFKYGLFFGSAFFALHFWWLYTLVVPVEPATRWLLNIGVTLLFVYLGLYVALFALAVKHLGIWWSPFIWAALEWLRSLGETGFPWGLLGSSLTPCVPLIQGASAVGVFGISALVVWLNVLLYRAIIGPRRILHVVLLAVSVLIPLGYGLVRVKATEPWFRVGIVQPNVSPYEKGSFSERARTWRDMLRLARSAVSRGARVIVFPETATLVDITRPGEYQDSLLRFADSSSVLVVTGTPLYGDGVVMNGTVAVVPGQGIAGAYAKIHLAPFSERFPYVDKVPLLRRIMTSDMGDAVPGRDYKVYDIGGRRFSTPICIEGIFPDLVRRFASRGAEMIVVVTNDGWFGKRLGPYQHNELMTMRAVENGVPLVRAANNGISQVVDPYGRVLSRTPLFEQTSLVQDVPAPLNSTFYRRCGDRFGPAAAVLTLLLLIIRILRSLRSRRRTAGRPS